MSNIISSVSKSKDEEFYALEYLKCRQNPLYFIYNYVHIPEIGSSLLLSKDHVHDKFRRVVRSIYRYHKVIFMASRQLGKALALDTPIPMAHGGYKSMGKIKNGDSILDVNGDPTKVVFTSEIMINRNCYRINFDNNDSIIADEEHLWKVTNDEFKSYIKTTKELFESPDTYNIPIPFSINYIKSKTSLEIPPYILGQWIVNGNIDGSINCYTDDYDDIREILKNYGCGLEVNYLYCSDYELGKLTIQKLPELLEQYKLLENRIIPDFYLNSTVHNRLLLLQGLMDAHGYCTPDQICKFNHTNINLIIQIKQLLDGLCIKNKLTSKIINNQNYYTLSFNSTKYYLFNLRRKYRKQHIFNRDRDYYNVNILSIEKVDSVPVKCIQVDNRDSLFLCGNTMIPTHNTTVAACLIVWAANFFPGIPIIILNMRQSAALENLGRIKFIHSMLPQWMKSPVKGRAERKTYLELENNSLIRTFYPASTIGPDQIARSLTAPILYIDEVSFIRHIDIAYRAAQPV